MKGRNAGNDQSGTIGVHAEAVQKQQAGNQAAQTASKTVPAALFQCRIVHLGAESARQGNARGMAQEAAEKAGAGARRKTDQARVGSDADC